MTTTNLPSPSISTKDTQTAAVQVALRVRPLTQQDRSQPRFSHSSDSDVIKTFGNTVTVVPHAKSFTFDYVFDTESKQEEVFKGVASNLVDRFLDGYNVTILAYGQTSSGKTYTMGTAMDYQHSTDPEQEGIIPRAMSALFDRLNPTTHLSTSPLSSPTNKKSNNCTFPPPSGLRIPRKTASSNKLRPASMMPSLSTNSSNNNPIRRGSAPVSHIDLSDKSTKNTVHVSFVEIYNEELIDLLNTAPLNERLPVTIREDTKGHIYWHGVKEVSVENTEEVLKYLQIGTDNRATGSTDMNAKSSRSHAIFTVTLKQEKWVPSSSKSNHSTSSKKRELSPIPTSTKSSIMGLSRRASSLNVRAMIGQMERQSKDDTDTTQDEDGDWVIVQSKFHFVDLAGSERLKRTAAQGDRRKEGININAGLLALGNVISALSDPSYHKKSTHVPYRDSKLTRLLQDSLGGNATTLMIACISPAELNLTETANTIKYAFRARSIKNKAERNEAEEWMTNDSPEFLRSLIGKLKMEIRNLKTSSTTSATNRAISPSSSIEHDPLPPSPSPSAVLHSTTTTNTHLSMVEHIDDHPQHHQQYELVIDLRRQIEELNNELIVTRERNHWIETQLENKKKNPLTNSDNSSSTSLSSTQSFNDEIETNHNHHHSNKPSTKNSHASNISHDSALGSLDFQHLVEPVIEEYEKSISGLESQLALARAALTHSDQVLAEQEKKIQDYQTLHDEEKDHLLILKDKLAKAIEREQTSDHYIQELETKLAHSTEEATRDQDILLSLKNKIIHFQEMDASTEQYIASLESKLAKAEENQERWNVLAEAAEQRLALQQKHMIELQKKIDLLNHPSSQLNNEEEEKARRESIHYQHESLLQEMEASKTQCNELKETLASIRRHSIILLESNGKDIQLNDTSSSEQQNNNNNNNNNNSKIQELNHQMEQKEAYISVLEKKLLEMDGLHEELSQLRTSHADKTIILEQQLTDMKENHLQLEQEKNKINEQLLMTQEEKSQLVTKNTELQKQLWEHEKGTQMTLRLRLDEVEKLKLELHQLQQLELKQEQIIHVFELKSIEMESSMTQLQKLLEAKNAHVEKLEKENQEKDNSLMMMKKEMETILRDMALLGMERKNLDMIISWLEKSLKKYDDKTTASLFSIAELQKIHTLRDADYEAKVNNIAKLESRILELSQSVEKGDTITQQLNQALTDAKAEMLDNNNNNNNSNNHEDGHQKKRTSSTIEVQRVHALESQIIELDKAVEASTKKNNVLKDELESTKEALNKAHANMEKQAAKLTQVETLLKETMMSMEKERELLAANDTTGMLTEMEEKVQILQRARQLDQDEYDSRIDKVMDDLEESRKENKEKNHMISSLEESLQVMQEKLEDAVTSHAKKSSQLQQLQDQLHRRNRADSTNRFLEQQEKEMNHQHDLSNYDLPPSASPVAGMQSYDVGCLLKQISQQELIIREKDELLTKLQIATSRSSSISPSSSLLNTEKLEREHRLSQQFNNDIKEDATREELLDQVKQFVNDKTQLMLQVDGLESQLVLQRNQYTVEMKNMELELMKLSSANDRMEKEMEQILPRYSLPPLSSSLSTSMISSSGTLPSSTLTSHLMNNTNSIVNGNHGNHKSSITNNFTSPPQTPRVSSPPLPSSSSFGYKLHRELSSSGSLAKLQKSNSFRAISALDHHPNNNQEDGKQSNNQTPRGSLDRPRSYSSVTSSLMSRTGSIPPPSAPPSNPLPPIPTTPLPVPPTATISTSSTTSSSTTTSSSSIASPTPSSPKPQPLQSSILQRHNSTNTTTSLLSDISLPNSQQSTQTTADQYEKLLRSLQRKTQVAESDVRAHQDVISKLEQQLSRSETSVRDAKKQLDVLNREKQAYSLEIQNLRSQVTQIMSQQKSTSDEAVERRKQLEQTLEQERKLKEKAEKARSILENRMEELMTKKNKFMCF